MVTIHTPAVTKTLVRATTTAFIFIRWLESSRPGDCWYLAKSRTGDLASSFLGNTLSGRRVRAFPVRGLNCKT